QGGGLVVFVLHRRRRRRFRRRPRRGRSALQAGRRQVHRRAGLARSCRLGRRQRGRGRRLAERPGRASRRRIGGGIEGVARSADRGRRRAACGGRRKRGGFGARAQLLLEHLNLVLELLDLASGLAQFALEPVDAGAGTCIPVGAAGRLAVVIAVLRGGTVEILRLGCARNDADKGKEERGC